MTFQRKMQVVICNSKGMRKLDECSGYEQSVGGKLKRSVCKYREYYRNKNSDIKLKSFYVCTRNPIKDGVNAGEEVSVVGQS